MTVPGLMGAALGTAAIVGVVLLDRVPGRASRPAAPRKGRRAPGSGPGRSWSIGAPLRVRRVGRGHGGPGAAHWAGRRDLGRLAVGPRRRHRPERPSAGNRVVLGRVGRRVVAAERAQSVIVFGPTQSHKTSGFAIPALLDWDGPVVAASVKTDLLEHTIGPRRARGEVLCFDPTGSSGVESAGWSPLPSARTWPGARRAASGMTEVVKANAGPMNDGDFWYATATRLLAPLLFAAAFGRLGMHDVIRWVATGEETEVLELLAATGVPEAVDAALSTFKKEERQRSSIYTTVETVLEPFGEIDPSAGTVDPSRVVDGQNTLYLCAPAHDQRRLTPLFVSLLRHVVEHVYDQVARGRRPLDPPVLLVLDEAANIAPLTDLDGLAATAAGHGVQLVTVWHDLAQITARYGARATTVVNNHRAKLFLSGISDPTTLDHASRLIGEEEVVLPSTTTGGRGTPTTTRALSTRRLAPPDALRRTPPGRGVLVYGDLPPVQLTLCPWYKDRRWTEGAPSAAVRPRAHPRYDRPR